MRLQCYRKYIKNEGNALIPECLARGLTVSRILVLLGISSSFYYHKSRMVQLRRGRKLSTTTEKMQESGWVVVADGILLQEIIDLLSREFVCYGYKEVTAYLRNHGYLINRKKTCRTMKENHLLNHTYNYHSPARRVVESIVRVDMLNEVWEMDINYTYIQGENRTAYFFAIIDCHTREPVGKYFGYHCTSQDVKNTMYFSFLDRGVASISRVRIRSDNGTQFVSRMA